MRLRSLLFLFTLLTGTSGNAIADVLEPISVVVTAAPSSPLNFNVTVTISNTGDIPVIISQAHLPFNWGGPLPNDQFRIKTYYNDYVKYLETYAEIDQNDPAAYVTLKGHASLSGIVNLHESYKFFGVVNAYDMFKVQFVLKMGDVSEADAPDQSSPDYATNPNRPREIVSNELTTYFTDNTARATAVLDDDKPIVLDGRSTSRLISLASSSPDGSSINDPRGTCDQSHAAAIDQAVFNAGEVAGTSDDLIRAMFPPLGYPPATVSSDLFLKWFGRPSVNNYPSSAEDYNGLLGTVVGHYKAVWTVASEQKQGKKYPILTSCDCPASRPAYVVAWKRGESEVTFCPRFFSLPPTGGPNSKALSALHELSHFRYSLLIGSKYIQVGVTGDYSYGTVGDLETVKTGLSAGNAENYEKFGIGAMAGKVGW